MLAAMNAPTTAPTDGQRVLYATTARLYARHAPTVSVERALDAVRAIEADPDQVAEALCLSLDWNAGIAYAPEFFASEFADWWARVEMDTSEGEAAREA